jgi:hypothetical protein
MAANGMTVTEVQAYHTEDSPRTEAHPAHAFQAVPWLPWQHVRVPTAIVPSGCRGVPSQQSRVVKSAPSAATGSRPSRLASSSIPTIQSGARSRPTDGSGGCGGCDGAAVSTSKPVGEDAPASADLTRERHTTIVSPRRLDAAFAARRARRTDSAVRDRLSSAHPRRADHALRPVGRSPAARRSGRVTAQDH